MSKHKLEIVVLSYMSQAPSDENSKRQGKVYEGSGTTIPRPEGGWLSHKGKQPSSLFSHFTMQQNAYNHLDLYGFY